MMSSFIVFGSCLPFFLFIFFFDARSEFQVRGRRPIEIWICHLADDLHSVGSPPGGTCCENIFKNVGGDLFEFDVDGRRPTLTEQTVDVYT
jgi:hypothetical protein